LTMCVLQREPRQAIEGTVGMAQDEGIVDARGERGPRNDDGCYARQFENVPSLPLVSLAYRQQPDAIGHHQAAADPADPRPRRELLGQDCAAEGCDPEKVHHATDE